ncbi:SDR family NAD(P)-dependent oxidoreductase [Succinivibrio dextrinosolvens]|jgi:hypothetical protein|uniref:SDR family NAD(P)-dependent oxidoreductase n=1 Tax=Succinivibrio dextrinosolvens TaxID=83771 RepID=UPI00241C1D62|nr:SDR family NAD(P)-dependent oxidoreductase [Succinivibrio dextrinosolvens]MBE6423103.1 SDR family NAD(P)-dependent oxidoreductase [Succinivibrio dextrinosolvens]
MAKKILVIGGSSEIIEATVREFYKDGSEIYLTCSTAESKKEALNKFIDINISCAYKLDLVIDNVVPIFIDILQKVQPDILLIASGYMPEDQLSQTHKTLLINFSAIAEILSAAAEYFKSRQEGSIAVLSSVAGDRGRYSNYVYGSAKAGLTTFLSGLRAELSHYNVHVTTIKCGIVDTRMSRLAGRKSHLAASKEKIGKSIYWAIKKKKNVVYLPSFWWLIMLIIRCIPESVFKHLKL